MKPVPRPVLDSVSKVIMRVSWEDRVLAPIVALAALLSVLTGCVPVPGSTVNACILCSHSEVSAYLGGAPSGPDASPEIPAPSEALSALLGAGSQPDTNTPEAAPGAADATAASVPLPETALPAPGPASATEPAPSAPNAGPGADVAPATEPPPDPEDPLAARLREVEGLSLTSYPDTGGVMHICHGHQITRGTCDRLLAQDLHDARVAAKRVVGEPTWSALSTVRREVVVEIAFMAGEGGLSGFERMLEALHAGDFGLAGDEIVASLLKPPARRDWLAEMMREG